MTQNPTNDNLDDSPLPLPLLLAEIVDCNTDHINDIDAGKTTDPETTLRLLRVSQGFLTHLNLNWRDVLDMTEQERNTSRDLRELSPGLRDKFIALIDMLNSDN